ncbi:MAG: DUF2666 family protein [DPANN group archaeon]|nr:DUF2666 family protein [DPANN group archaeon]
MDFEKDHILFDGKYGKWTLIVKQDIDATVEPIEVARVLGRVRLSTHKKTWEYIGSHFDIEKLDEIAANIVGATRNPKKGHWELKARAGENAINEALVKLKSPKLLSDLNLEMAEEKAIAKAYLNRRVLDFLKFPIELMYFDDAGKIVDLVDTFLTKKQKKELGA